MEYQSQFNRKMPEVIPGGNPGDLRDYCAVSNKHRLYRAIGHTCPCVEGWMKDMVEQMKRTLKDHNL